MLIAVLRIVAIGVLVYLILAVAIYLGQRSLIFFPSHAERAVQLSQWSDGQGTIGYCREVSQPRALWLMMHGNAGQAADRDYVLPCLPERESFYVLEYPGYGARPGAPSMTAINQAAAEAYRLLRARNPGVPVCVLGESIGSGPACVLAREKVAPDKIVLVVPFDSLANVAVKRFPIFPVRLMLRDNWNNAESLRGYTGPVQIFGALDDAIIPLAHAEALARQIPQARVQRIRGGHNDWSLSGEVRIEY